MRFGDSDSILIGVGAGFTLIALLVLQSLTGNGLLSTKTVTEIEISAVTRTQQQQVIGSFATHMLALQSRNVSAFISQYAQNATLTWAGQTLGLQGDYNGTDKIELLISESFIGRANSLTVGNVTQSVVAPSGGLVKVNSSFGFAGFSPKSGPFNGKVSAQDSFAYSTATNSWLVSHEVWNFTAFDIQFPVPDGCYHGSSLV